MTEDGGEIVGVFDFGREGREKRKDCFCGEKRESQKGMD